MKIFKYFIIFIIILYGALSNLYSKPTMAFGYLHNKTNHPEYSHLEMIFPKTFANSIKHIYDVNVLRPNQLDKKLDVYKKKLRKDYNFFELPDLLDMIKSDYFIYGHFIPLPDNKIKIIIHYYEDGKNRIFTFSYVGSMETSIFDIVDHITQIFIKYMDGEYHLRNVKKNSRLAIITNLDGDKLNTLYYSFLKKGLKISSFQGNTIVNTTDIKKILPFKYIYSPDNSYNIITDVSKIKFLRGSWGGDRYTKEIKEYERIYKYYDINYYKTKKKILTDLVKGYKNTIDYILIIGFDGSEKSTWVRCVDIRKRDLIWMKSDISGNSISQISEKIIKELTTPVKFKGDLIKK